MPAQRLPMRQVREVLLKHASGQSDRQIQIAAAVGISRHTVAEELWPKLGDGNVREAAYRSG